MGAMMLMAIRFKGIGAVALLSCFIAGCVGALTGSSVADNAAAVPILVNRINKSDRLPQGTTLKQRPNSSSPTEAVSPKRMPLGCDPAFSPVVDPALAHIFKRCMV